MSQQSDSLLHGQPAITEKYDREAETYDRARSGLFFELAGGIISEMAGPCDGLSVLDVPVGTGRIMPFLKGAASVRRYVGVDIAPGMTRVSQRNADQAGIPRYQGSLGSLWKLPFASEQFDLVLVLRLFHLFPPETYAEALREVHRVLKPGGSAIVEVRNRYRGVALAPIRRWLDARDPRELPHHYIGPRQLTRAFGDLRIEETRGYWFDGSQILERAARRSARRINLALSRTPARYLASELVVKATRLA